MHNNYYNILNEFFPQNMPFINDKNLLNLEKENIIKHIEFNDNKSEGDTDNNNYKYIIYGYIFN
jgi:hypothetical protein